MKFDLHGFYQDLCQTIIPYLEKHLLKNDTFSQAGITVSEPIAAHPLIRLSFPTTQQANLYVVMRYLEGLPYMQYRIYRVGKQIVITEDEAYKGEKETSIERIKTFLFNLERRTVDLGIAFTLLTPYAIASTESRVTLRLRVNSIKNAHKLCDYVDIHWAPELEKKFILKMEVPIEDMQRYNSGAFTPKSSYEEKTPGLVIPLQRTGESVVLTEREKQILLFICEECNDAEIARKLHIVKSAVKRCVGDLLLKINAKTIAGLAIYAMKTGLFSLTEIPALGSEDEKIG